MLGSPVSYIVVMLHCHFAPLAKVMPTTTTECVSKVDQDTEGQSRMSKFSYLLMEGISFTFIKYFVKIKLT